MRKTVGLRILLELTLLFGEAYIILCYTSHEMKMNSVNHMHTKFLYGGIRTYNSRIGN